MNQRPLLIRAAALRSFGSDALPADADAVLIERGRIGAIAPHGQIANLRPDAQVLDLPGATLTPGFTDAHIHLTEWALARRSIDLSGSDSPAAAAARLTAARPIAGWIRGRGWSLDEWSGARPNRVQLDALAPNVPTALQSHDMHAFWVNSAALRAAGIDASTADPNGGVIERAPDGAPTGLLLENAAALVTAVLPRPSDAEVRDAVSEAQRALHALGFTGVHSLPGIHTPEPSPREIIGQLHERGGLRLRVLAHMPVYDLDDAIRAGIRSADGSDWIRTGGVKMFLDGTLGSRTAWMLEPYVEGSGCGVQVLDPTQFRDTATRAAGAGIATTIHAIGDAAVALAIDTLAPPESRVRALPHRIEHVQCLPLDRAPLLASIVCSVQPCHLISDWRAADALWGGERAARTFAFRTMLDAGATLALGSDAPVEPPDPMRGLHAAVQRRDVNGSPDEGWYAAQRLSAREAVRAYTWGPALAAGWHDRLGQLAPGYAGDIAAWDRDPTDPPNRSFMETTCVATIVAGEVVHGP